MRETKSTKNYEKLRYSEADKIKCGRKHFEAIGADFDVVVSACKYLLFATFIVEGIWGLKQLGET
ncbi:MAG: hypothetical protein EAZ41_00200 [Sphingobacteriia bacterium]|nr:MAG: hypothetical protein EAZ41_00200 [Sphingobacteriia bacterium]